MEQVTGRFARRNVGPLGEIMGRRHEAIAESSGSYEMPACKRDWPHKLGRLRIYERRKRIQDIMNGETAVGSCRGVAGREGNKGGRLLREIFIARDISQLHLLTVYEGNSGERGNFRGKFHLGIFFSMHLRFGLSLNTWGWSHVGKNEKQKTRKKKELPMKNKSEMIKL